jgi:hypothetical protein
MTHLHSSTDIPVSASGNPPAKLLALDAEQFRQNMWRRGFNVSHELCGAPELQLPRLVELAQRLPAKQVVYWDGDLEVNQPERNGRRRNGLTIAETIRSIEECHSWMALRNIQTDPEYNALMHRVLDEAYAQIGSSVSGMHREEAFVFVSSPNSVTPFHLDEEHNFLLQIRGSKDVSLWDPTDRIVIPEERMEHQLQLWKGEGYYANIPFKDEFQSRATVFHLEPGAGVYFPVGAPHWVKNGPQVSISFSVTFRSYESRRQAVVYFMNRKIRKCGLNPVPPGRSPWRDSLKYGAFETGRRTAALMAGSWLRRNQTKWA